MKERIVIELEIEGSADLDDVCDVVDNLLDVGTIQDAIWQYVEDTDVDHFEITSATCRPAGPAEVHVGFVIHQATGQLCWSKAFTSEKAARDYAEAKAKDRNYRHKPGEPLEFVSRVESYEVQS